MHQEGCTLTQPEENIIWLLDKEGVFCICYVCIYIYICHLRIQGAKELVSPRKKRKPELSAISELTTTQRLFEGSLCDAIIHQIACQRPE